MDATVSTSTHVQAYNGCRGSQHVWIRCRCFFCCWTTVYTPVRTRVYNYILLLLSFFFLSSFFLLSSSSFFFFFLLSSSSSSSSSSFFFLSFFLKVSWIQPMTCGSKIWGYQLQQCRMSVDPNDSITSLNDVTGWTNVPVPVKDWKFVEYDKYGMPVSGRNF